MNVRYPLNLKIKDKNDNVNYNIINIIEKTDNALIYRANTDRFNGYAIIQELYPCNLGIQRTSQDRLELSNLADIAIFEKQKKEWIKTFEKNNIKTHKIFLENNTVYLAALTDGILLSEWIKNKRLEKNIEIIISTFSNLLKSIITRERNLPIIGSENIIFNKNTIEFFRFSSIKNKSEYIKSSYKAPEFEYRSMEKIDERTITYLLVSILFHMLYDVPYLDICSGRYLIPKIAFREFKLQKYLRYKYKNDIAKLEKLNNILNKGLQLSKNKRFQTLNDLENSIILLKTT